MIQEFVRKRDDLPDVPKVISDVPGVILDVS
jgi:hypothetical protein